MPHPILRPGSPGSRLWLRFSDRIAPILALITLLIFFGVASLAPLLSQDRPIFMDDSSGAWTSPLFRSFSGLDWLWLGLLASFCSGYLMLRLFSGRKWAVFMSMAGAATVMAVALTIIGNHEQIHERRRYRIEQTERLLLLEFDRDIAAKEKSRPELVELGQALSERIGGSQVVSLALFERLAFLNGNRPTDKELVRLAQGNMVELVRLERATYPLNRFDPQQPGDASLLLPGVQGHKLGSDELGRDVLARLVYGSRTSLTVAIGASILIALLGLLFGLIGGYYGGFVDRCLSRFTELVLCLPALAILVAAPAWLPREWRQSPSIFVAFLGFILWPQAARLVRNEVRKTRDLDYVRSAIALGLKDSQVIVRHILPNIVPPLLVSLGLTAGNLILLESTLSFLGLGPTDQPSWGRMLADSRGAAVVGDAWHLAVFPGITVVICMFAFNILSQSLGRALNPKRA
ncbi:MAG: peptide/nickel transport system permease protein [Planctomycetota bacterium]|jgi:peptide/nickel transport system permease protein